MALLFAYGTLQPGLAPPESRGAVANMALVGEAVATGRLYNLGKYPGAIFDENHPETVGGVLLQFPADAAMQADLLRLLDRYEGFFESDVSRSLFVRRRLIVTLADGKREECWAYEYNRTPRADRLVPGGRYIPNGG